MDRFITRAVRTGVVAASVFGLAAPAVAAASPAGAGTVRDQAKSCAQKFEKAQRTDMESFRDFDWDTWIHGHDKGVVSIVADGRVRTGLDAVAAASRPRFDSKDSVWSWTELTRKVDGCSTGFVVYTTKYAIPRLDYWFTAVTTVTYEFKHGRWLVILDQGTLLEEHVGSA
ncbi:hypothetical protein AB0L70_13875 [Kribbella sp. NPDC051952]|uniref:hypothetical protein n=1 Tax=Kribbella sp. NPDC051952 TaxID=3154851 RepID=UPI003423F449